MSNAYTKLSVIFYVIDVFFHEPLYIHTRIPVSTGI